MWRFEIVLTQRLLAVYQWLRLVTSRIILSTKNRKHTGRVGLVTSMELADNQELSAVLGLPLAFRSCLFGSRAAVYIGWGRKFSGKQALSLSAAKGGKLLLVEDGFLRSFGREDRAVSLVIDRQGIYYDSTAPSDLEVFTKAPLSPLEEIRSRGLIAAWRRNRVSKYNDQLDYAGELPSSYVLVADQVKGDLSIAYGLADESSFQKMLSAALSENPDKVILVKLHPDGYTRSAASHFESGSLRKMARVQVIAENCHPVKLIENADAIYTVTSQVGFEALIWGKKVRTFGMPFYAGWGLTEDELPGPERRGKATLEQLVYAALVKYPRYICPLTRQRCEAERALGHIALQREKRLEFAHHITGVGFSRWKKPFVKYFLQGSDVVFIRKLPFAQTSSEQSMVVWGNKYHSQLQSRANVLRLEDGFLRSSGLGADLVRPLSLIIDDVGIYYDATRPSRLENILSQQELNQKQIARAAQLRKKIVGLKLTKYNVGAGDWKRPDTPYKVVLVVGQVESDASIEFGSPDVKANIELLKNARLEDPNAYIVYKPHPDVIAKLRRQGKKEDQARLYCDEIVANLPADALFGQIDELHTMTSLMGFEALMRGIHVVCHGIPFYAGWGLTTDKLKCGRRNRKLTLDELVYGTLITYPRYFHQEKELFIEPEVAIDELANSTLNGVQTRSWSRKVLRLVIIFWVKIRNHDKP